jgi:hypothetical protein
MGTAGTCLGVLKGIRDKIGKGYAIVHDAIDKAGVGPVFQQAAHQVGQQGTVTAHGGIHPHRPPQPRILRPQQLPVETVPHAMQALEFVVSGAERTACFENGGDGMGVMGGEQRKDRIGHGQQTTGTRQVGYVSVGLAGIDGIVDQAVLLGALDLRIPVGALDQANHQAPTVATRHGNQPVDDRRRPLLVSLHDKTQARPFGQSRVCGKRSEHIERQFKPLRLLRINGQPDVVALGQQAQMADPRHEFMQHPRLLGPVVARMQRRELDGDAVALVNTPPAILPANGVDGMGVSRGVACCLVRRHGGLAEHVKRITVVGQRVGARTLQRGLDGFAQHELLSDKAHGVIHGLPDQRLPTPHGDAFQRPGNPCRLVGGKKTPGEGQAPGRRIHEHGRAMAHMGRPVPSAQFVSNQAQAGVIVGHPQQGFGQTHQCHALAAVEGELVHQRIDPPGPPPPLAHADSQLSRQSSDTGRLIGGGTRVLNKRLHTLRLGPAGGRPDSLAQGCQRGLRGGRIGIGDNSHDIT